jgi:hypothetical protein
MALRHVHCNHPQELDASHEAEDPSKDSGHLTILFCDFTPEG